MTDRSEGEAPRTPLRRLDDVIEHVESWTSMIEGDPFLDDLHVVRDALASAALPEPPRPTHHHGIGVYANLKNTCPACHPEGLPAPLDVERLAESLAAAGFEAHPVDTVALARDAAAEYARLSDSGSPTPERQPFEPKISHGLVPPEDGS